MFKKLWSKITNIYDLIVYHTLTLLIEIVLVGVIQVTFEYGDRKIYILVWLMGLFFHQNCVKLLKLVFGSKKENKDE